ncbi:MAG: TadE family protein [Actinomycetota bacterium]
MNTNGSPSRSGSTERGSASIEFAIIMSALIFGFFGLMIVAGRIMNQQNEVRSAAEAAARAASLEPTLGDAAAAAETVGLENLADAGVNCRNPTVTITSPAADFIPGGLVTVTVRCTASSLGTLSLPDNEFFHEATEAIDVYRADP